MAGLGNPGVQYQHTRHNAGFVAIDRLVTTLGVSFTRNLEGGLVAKAHVGGGPVLLVKPQLYMNLSGRSVSRIAARYGCLAENILVIADDVNLPLGTIRLRPGGSAGGHKGLASVIAELGTNAFPRLRMGVGKDQPLTGDLTNFVLGKFSSEELPSVETMVEHAAVAAFCWIEHGIEIAMNRFNAVPGKGI